ncbi:MAG: TonB family protein [Lysobacteraceae bacterium]|nr:MAG: TonB family protein [Xanthomonadaceae bacterium]
MRTLLCLLLLLIASSPVNAEEMREFQTQVTGRIEVGADGVVSGHALDERLDPAVRNAVDRNIRGWRFEPVVVDGRPVIATTTLRLQLTAVPVEGDYALKVDKVWFGEPQRAHALPSPAYPPDAQRQGIQGRVMLVIRLDASGSVAEVHAEQTSLSVSTRGKRGQHWRRMFEDNSIEVAKSWKFNVTEIVNGNPVGGSIRVPVDYAFKGDSWMQYLPGPVVPAPWVEAGALADAGQTPDQAQPLDSRFKLRTQIVGTTL